MTKDRLNILIYNGDFNVPTFVYKLAVHLAKQGHQVTLMGHSSITFPYRNDHIRYYPLPLIEKNSWLLTKVLFITAELMLKNPLSFPEILKSLKKDYQKNKGKKGRKNWLMDFIRLSACKILKPNVIHNQWPPKLPSIGLLFYHYPIIQSLHGRTIDVSPFYHSQIAETYRNFFPFLSGVQSASNNSLINANQFGLKTNNVLTNYSLTEKENLHSKKTYTKKNTPIKIISVGRFYWMKGYPDAIHALSLIKDKINFNYEIIGWGDPTEARFHIEDMKLQDFVKLSNYIPHEKVFNKIYNSDIFLLPSRQEGFATVVTEAMAVGTFVISTDCGGMQELLEDRVNALLVPPQDPKAIANAILSICQMSIDEITQITANAQSLVKERLLWEDQIHNYIRLYKNSLN